MKKVKLALLILAVLGVIFGIYKIFEPTRVLFVNFRDWQVAEYVDANTNWFIRVKRSSIEDITPRLLNRSDFVLVFGMGARFDDAQREMFLNAAKDGVNFVFVSSTVPEDDLTNVDIAKVNTIREYISQGGKTNINFLLNYVRSKIHGKWFFVDDFSDPIVRPSEFFSHPSVDSLFGSFSDIEHFYKNNDLYKKNSPRVLILTSNISIANRTTSDPFVSLVKKLEARGLNVFVASGFRSRLKHIQEVNPAIVLLFAHGRLQPGMPKESVELLKQKNIPLLSPLVVHQIIEEWESDQMGMAGGMLSQSIVAPEIDGATTPFVIGGLSYNQQGYQVFTAIDERVKRFASVVENHIKLSQKENSQKRLAIVYFKGPGLNALTAGGLEVTPSLLNVLKALRDNGYNLGDNLPETAEELDDMINRLGPVLGPYAKGSIHEFMQNPQVIRIHADTLLHWMRKHLRSELVDSVISHYGQPPGEHLVSVDTADGSRYLVLPGIKFGNVMILPQLMSALGDDQFELVHGVDSPPPFPYIATYLYAREGHRADALIHFGTHGSLEFTPNRQSALSSLDWPDALVGDIPHFYIYTINNIGEAIIAKRRSYAGIISHITPPFTISKLHGGLYDLHNYIHQYETVEDGPLKTALFDVIFNKIVEEELHLDLSIEHILEDGLDEKSFERVHRHLHIVGMEKITEGLYTIGKSYTQEQAISTVVEMFGDRLAYAKAGLDILEGKIQADKIEDLHFFEENYLISARDIVSQIARGKFKGELVNSQTMAKYGEYKKHIGSEVQGDVFGAMMAMGGRQVDVQSQKMDSEQLENCIIIIASKPEFKELFLSLADDERFKKMQSLLDANNLRQARRMANVVAPMRRAIEFLDIPCAPQLIRHLSQSQEERDRLINMVKGGEFKELVEMRKRVEADSVAKLLSLQNSVAILRIAADGKAFRAYIENNKNFNRFVSSKAIIEQFLNAPKMVFESSFIDEHLKAINKSETQRANLTKSLDMVKSHSKILKSEMRDFVKKVEEIKDIQNLTAEFVGYIKNSGNHEINSLINALNGGFIPPSSGGDAIHNPNALPTGRNLYGIDAETTPGTAAWNAGVNLARQMLERELAVNGRLPRKVAFTFWGGEFIKDQGTTIAQVLYLLGVEPVRTTTGRVQDVRLIPANELGRPRIDVVVQTSGQFRDIASSRLFLIDKAVRLAAQAVEDSNFVRDNVREAESFLKERGFSPVDAREWSTARIFGGVGGNYGTGIMGLVESGDKWESDTVIANQYIRNMGAVYTQGRWGEFREGVFEAGLINTDVIMHTRSSNTWGPLSLDHVYEFMGGLSSAVKKVTGTAPQGLFIDMRNPGRMAVVDAREAIWTEARSTILNPRYISPLLEGGRSSAEVFAETVRNTFGWNATKESVIDEELWDKYYETLVRDTLGLGITEFFNNVNPYALQEITAVMLEAVRKEMWSPDSAVIKDLAKIHVKLVEEHRAGCSGFVCDNIKLIDFIADNVQNATNYRQEIQSTRQAPSIGEPADAITLRKEETITETIVRIARDNTLFLVVLTGMIAILIIPVFIKRKKDY